MYFVVEIFGGFPYTKQTTWGGFLTLFILPSFFWLLGPAYRTFSTLWSLQPLALYRSKPHSMT
jgi:hypothetical protein